MTSNWVDSGANVYIDGGKVGIGSSSTPGAPLDVVVGTNIEALRLTRIAGDNPVLLRFGFDETSGYPYLQGDRLTYNPQPLLLNPSGANVGVGVTSPTARLEVAGDVKASGPVQAESGRTTGYIWTDDRLIMGHGTEENPALRFTDDGGAGLYRTATGGLGLVTSSHARLVIDEAGRVGINKLAPQAALDVHGDVQTDVHYVAPLGLGQGNVPTYGFAGDDNTGMYNDGHGELRFLSNGAVQISINRQGYVGIGPADASAKLHVDGTILADHMIVSGAPDYFALQVVVPGLGGVVIDTGSQSVRPLDAIHPYTLGLAVPELRWYAVHVGAGDSEFTGRVRIGAATAPAHTLDVTGDIRATGDITTAGNIGATGSIGATGGITTDHNLTVTGITRLYGDVYVGPGQQKLAFNAQGQVLYA